MINRLKIIVKFDAALNCLIFWNNLHFQQFHIFLCILIVLTLLFCLFAFGLLIYDLYSLLDLITFLFA